jgi:selenocysteine-specific translation elongation factor
MKSLSRNLAFATGLLLLSAPKLLAAESEIQMDLTSYTQTELSVSSTTEKGKISKLRLNSKQMLKLLAKQAGVDVSSGSKLKFDDTGKVFIVDSKKDRRTDVTRYLSAELDLRSQLFEGKKDLETQKENSTRYFPVTFTMDISGLNGSVQGLVIEKFKTTAPDKDGVQRITTSSNTPFNGQGSINGKAAYFDGDIVIKSRAATISK